MVQLAAYLSIQNSNAAMFCSLIVIAIAFGLNTLNVSKPFRLERAAVAFSIILAYLAVAHAFPEALLAFVHVHDDLALLVVQMCYNLLWILIAAVTLIGFIRSPKQRSVLVWLLASGIALLLALIPLEVNLPREGMAIALVRFNVAFGIYLLVAIGDAAYLTEFAYICAGKKATEHASPLSPHDQARSPVRQDHLDVSLLRTLTWLPLALLPLYVRPFFIVIPTAILILLAYVAAGRYQLATLAKQHYRQGQPYRTRDSFVRPGRTGRHHQQAQHLREVITNMDTEMAKKTVKSLWKLVGD
jgi:hypothetical protein